MSGRGSTELREAEDRYSLRIANPRKNVFVTQLDEGRDEEEGDVNYIPIITEPASKIVETSANTLQKTLVLKKEIEFDHVSALLVAKQLEFKKRMESLEQKRAEFIKRQENYKENALKFDKFLKDNNAKEKRALQKYQDEVKVNNTKQEEINELTQELEELRLRQQKLRKMTANYKIYEDYLSKVVAQCPKNYLDTDMDTQVKAVLWRHEALSATNQNLLSHLVSQSEDYEEAQHKLEELHQEHNTTMLMLNSEISQLQTKYDKLQETNNQLELEVNILKSHFRLQKEELSSLLLCIANLAEQCHMPHYGPLQNLPLLSKLDMIKEFILEKITITQLSS
ncbi:uncharacterized protein CCDC197 [Microcaecilia unicolor]|uniref:Uncharacterized protein CCDC197 n=1 Tax=Microcaecilia unicolor TaxID=1415580 RepID=A0A6P7Z0W6_9AMPH|nr:uncharacterized protein CCDC197 [Microcaecilia unicolor]